jgi:hypothetical protein
MGDKVRKRRLGKTNLLAKFSCCAALVSVSLTSFGQDVVFTPIQEELFSDAYGQSNAWGDYDNDGDLDLAVLFLDRPVRLYENDGSGEFSEVAASRNLIAPNGNARSVAWADYDADGDLDLYIGYADRVTPNQLLENQLQQGSLSFVEVGADKGVALIGLTRQVNFIDFDSDGDLDLHVAIRNANNYLFKNTEGSFTNVAGQVGFYEPRRTVGACWFDMDGDGDLDAFTANQSGDRDGLYRYEDGRFEDVAMALNMDQAQRPLVDGGVGCAVADYDNDGDLDLYVAEYGDDSLFRNNADGSFTDVASAMGIAVHDHIVTGVWGDVNNDGLQDLYIVGYVNGKPGTPDYLFINKGDHFENQIPANVMAYDTDHGVQFADIDNDGDLDLALAANDPAGSHYVFRNELPNPQASLKIQVLDSQGAYVMAGTEVRVYTSDTDELLGLRMLDTGSGYNSQNAMPVHVATGSHEAVDVEVRTMSVSGGTLKRLENLKVSEYFNSTLVIRAE